MPSLKRVVAASCNSGTVSKERHSDRRALFRPTILSYIFDDTAIFVPNFRGGLYRDTVEYAPGGGCAITLSLTTMSPCEVAGGYRGRERWAECD
jgi:hypothetical protein